MKKEKSHAQKELDILIKSNTDLNNRPIIEEFIPEILALVEKFMTSGQSGGSAPFVASAISSAVKKLCLFEAISPITGIEDEWFDVTYDTPWFQNIRCSSLFKDGIDAKPYYIDAIIKKSEDGTCWSGGAWLNKEDYKTGDRSLMITSKAYIKGFPFEPKTFYIDVIDEEISKDNWESFIKDPKQLEDVWEYYEK